MNDKYVNMVFKISILLIGVGFLVVYYFHSHNGRFHEIKDDDSSIGNILDTRTGIVSFVYVSKQKYVSVNSTNGIIKIRSMSVTDESKFREPNASEQVAPDKPRPSAEDFLKGKK